jgi:inner membrane protein
VDNLTHTLFAITVARTLGRSGRSGRSGRGTTAALILASNAPDIDIVAATGGSVSYLQWHRGPTHGLLGIVGLGLLTAGLVWAGQRELDKIRPPVASHPAASFQNLAAISTVGVLLHVLMDLPTSYGTRIFSPFDWHWFALDWLPIIDVYLLAILAVGLGLAELSNAPKTRIAALVLLLIAADYGVRAASHYRALTLSSQLFASRLPARCDERTGTFIAVWPRLDPARRADAAPCLVEIAAVPTFGSPFRWNVIARLSNAYELHELDVLEAWRNPSAANGAFWSRAVRYPDQWQRATINAAEARTARVFLGFSRFPAARTFVDPTGTATVRWNDMRFANGTIGGDALRPADLFNVVVRVGADGSIKQERLGRN